MPEPGPLQLQLRPNVRLEVAEFALVAGLFSADVHCHIYLTGVGFPATARVEVERRWLRAAAQLDAPTSIGGDGHDREYLERARARVAISGLRAQSCPAGHGARGDG